MELLEGIETRRSFRAFKSTPISSEIIVRILKAAGKSPSYCNTQPWEVAVVSGEKREKLGGILFDLSKSEVPPNPDIPMPKTWPPELEKRNREHHEARRFCAIGIERGNEQQRKESRLLNFTFYGAPSVLFLFMDSTLGSWSIFDMGIFTQSIVLAAHSFGLGSCIQALLTWYPDAIREFLGIPRTKKLIVGISVGYPDFEASINTYRSKKVHIDDFVQYGLIP